MQSQSHKELAPERQQRLLQELARNGAARVDELSIRLGVSVATVRRDMERLEAQGAIQRVHGGAVAAHVRQFEPLFEDKAAIASDEKRAIAAAAVALIGDGDTVYLDGGSTVLELAKCLRQRESVTVVTNSLRAAYELSRGGPRLILIGGELRHRSQTLIGALSRPVLETIHLDKAFMGTIGVSMEAGLTTTDPNEAFTKELVMARARQVILLTHSEKIGKVAFANAGAVHDVHVLITDSAAPDRFVKQVRKIGCRVLTVPSGA